MGTVSPLRRRRRREGVTAGTDHGDGGAWERSDTDHDQDDGAGYDEEYEHEDLGGDGRFSQGPDTGGFAQSDGGFNSEATDYLSFSQPDGQMGRGWGAYEPRRWGRGQWPDEGRSSQVHSQGQQNTPASMQGQSQSHSHNIERRNEHLRTMLNLNGSFSFHS